MSKRLCVGVAIANMGMTIGMTMGMMSLASAQDAAPAAVAAAECTGQGSFSKAISKQLGAAQDAVKARKYEDIVAKVDEAAAVDKPKTEFDEFWIHRFRGNAYAGLKQFDKAVQEFEVISDSPCLKQEEKAEHFKIITRIYGQMENYPKVVEYGNRVLQLGPDPDVSSWVGQSAYLNKDFAGARRVLTELIEPQIQQDKQPDEQNLRLYQSSCTQLKDDACSLQQFERLVKYYPKPEHWQNTIILLSRDPKSTDKQQLNIIRLATYLDVLKDGQTYCEDAQIAIDQGLPGEAQWLLEKGMEQKLFNDARLADRAKRLLAEAKQAVANDKSTLAQQDAAARANKAGNADVKIGAAYLTYGEHAKAIEALQRGIAKGGVKDAAEANLMLGIAYLRSGNKPEAAKAFQAVNGDALTTRLARLWLLNT